MVFISKKIRYRIEDLLTGKDVWGNYLFLRDSQWWDKEKIENYQLLKLKKLLLHCYKNVPAYTYIMDKAGFNPETIKSVKEIEKLPVLTKEYILGHYNDFVPLNLTSIKGYKHRKTSGTTGQVLKFINDAGSRSMVWGSFLRFHDWMGRDFNNKYIVFRGRNFVSERLFSRFKNHLADFIENSRTLDSYALNDNQISILINLLNENPKAILRGYVLNIVDIATILKQKGLSYSIQAVSTTAEPLLDFHRKIIQTTFNCGVFDQYGCGEIEGVAYECEQHNGLHITEEHVIVETDNNDELIITDLDNYSFPFIRYKNGDKVLFSDSQCSCGRPSRMIKKIIGRTSDNVVGLNGQLVHWGYFHHLLIYTNIATDRNLVKFQVVQNTLSELILNIQSDPLTNEDIANLSKEIKLKFGEVKLSIKNVSNIPSSESGKFKAIISHVTNPLQ